MSDTEVRLGPQCGEFSAIERSAKSAESILFLRIEAYYRGYAFKTVEQSLVELEGGYWEAWAWVDRIGPAEGEGKIVGAWL